MIKKILRSFDKVEDRVRASLSRAPIIYALIGGVGIVLFWRGVWGLSEDWGMSNWQAVIVSLVIMLSTGLFVSFFIGDHFIIAGLKGEKKIIEKTKEEILSEQSDIRQVLTRLEILEKKIDTLVQTTDTEDISESV